MRNYRNQSVFTSFFWSQKCQGLHYYVQELLLQNKYVVLGRRVRRNVSTQSEHLMHHSSLLRMPNSHEPLALENLTDPAISGY